MTEITLELTDYCPNRCWYCSSNSSPNKNTFLTIEQAETVLQNNKYDRINLSGGEPLAHPQLWDFICLCKQHLNEDGVIVFYTNAIQAIAYNATILPGGVKVMCNLPVHENVDEIHVLKLVDQGRAKKNMPKIHFSKNFKEECDCKNCKHLIVRPDGLVSPSPCAKDTKSFFPPQR